MKITRAILPLIFIPFMIGCNALNHFTGKTGSPSDTNSDILTITAVSNRDYPGVEGFRTDNSTISVRVAKAGTWITLNQYEYTVGEGKVTLGHEVSIVGGSITYQSPFVPIAPAGTTYEITSILNH